MYRAILGLIGLTRAIGFEVHVVLGLQGFGLQGLQGVEVYGFCSNSGFVGLIGLVGL